MPRPLTPRACVALSLTAILRWPSLVRSANSGLARRNSPALEKCGDYIVAQFKAAGLTVTEQRTKVTGWDGKQLGCRNIIAAFHPERKDRVVLAAHYDSRPWAEKDADSTRHRTPVMAADMVPQVWPYCSKWRAISKS